MSLVRLQDVRKRYGQGAASVEALRGVDLEVTQGEFVAIVGRSGSGKSTLMNLLAGLDRPTSGAVVVDDADMATLAPRSLAAFRGSRIGIVFQSFHLLPGRSALENVALPLALDGVPTAERNRRASASLAAVGLDHREDHSPAELSGGEQQRVAIARALVREPALLLCDEPTGNLDTTTADEVAKLLEQLNRDEGRTVVMITHEQELARRLASRIVTLKDGVIETEERLASPADVT